MEDCLFCKFKEDKEKSVIHIHAHLIPRYDGDVETLRGAIRSVIPQKQNY